MPFTLQQLKDAAAELSLAQQAELAQFLVRSLDAELATDIRREWLSVAERRLADVKAGKVTGIPADEVLNTLLESGQ